MIEKHDLLPRLQAAGILDGIRWAYDSAVSRTLDDYSENAGHDAAWLGSTRFILFRDRLDRVFACGKYALQPGDDASAGLDLLRAELTNHDIETMPSIDPELVQRADLNLSPGWLIDGLRFLLASCEFGKIDSLPWPQKSPTKRTVALQSNPEPLPTLFDGMPDVEACGLQSLGDTAIEVDTFVVAHTLDAVSHKRELVFGRPRLNSGGGNAWHWYENLLAAPPLPGGRQDLPGSSGPDPEPDAPVRLLKKVDRRATVDGQR